MKKIIFFTSGNAWAYSFPPPRVLRRQFSISKLWNVIFANFCNCLVNRITCIHIYLSCICSHWEISEKYSVPILFSLVYYFFEEFLKCIHAWRIYWLSSGKNPIKVEGVPKTIAEYFLRYHCNKFWTNKMKYLGEKGKFR